MHLHVRVVPAPVTILTLPARACLAPVGLVLALRVLDPRVRMRLGPARILGEAPVPVVLARVVRVLIRE